MIQMLIIILDCNIVKFKVLKLIVNCLSLISFELRIRKKIMFKGHFAHKCRTLGGYLQNVMLTNRKI